MSDKSAPTKVISDFEAKLDQADKAVVSFEQEDRSLLRVIRGFLHANATMIPALILIVSVIFFGAVAPRFMSPGTLSLVLQQVTVIGIIALAQTIIILTAGIDLSVGAVTVLCSIIMARLSVITGINTPLAILIGIAAGGVMGAINGSLVTYIKLPPFIVTLGTWNIFNALKLFYSKSESVRNVDLEEQAPFLLWFGKVISFSGANVAYGGIALIVLAFLVWYLLNRTAWGRHVHAIGDDPDAAMLAGIQTDRTLVSVYALAGVICGIAAWVMIGRVGTASPQAIETANLDSITATVIGGTSLFGGRGSVVGSVLGALIVGVFFTGLSLAGVDDYWQIFTVGVLTIVAVAVDQWLRRASQ